MTERTKANAACVTRRQGSARVGQCLNSCRATADMLRAIAYSRLSVFGLEIFYAPLQYPHAISLSAKCTRAVACGVMLAHKFQRFEVALHVFTVQNNREQQLHMVENQFGLTSR